MTLPTLVHPSQTTSDNWFIIENTRDKSLEVVLKTEISSELSTFLTVELLARWALLVTLKKLIELDKQIKF